MIGLVGLIVALILLLIFLVLPLSDWRSLWQWMKEWVKQTRARRIRPSPRPAWAEEKQAPTSGKSRPYPEAGRQVLRRMARAQESRPREGAQPPPRAKERTRTPPSGEAPTVRWPVLVMLLFVLLLGLFLSLYPLLASRFVAGRRHHLTVLVAVGQGTAESEKFRQTLRSFLDASGLTHTVSLQTVTLPPTAEAAYTQVTSRLADFFLWGHPEAGGQYALTLTVHPRPDPGRPELGEYLHVMVTPSYFSLSRGGGLTVEDAAWLLSWMARFYLGEFEWAEAALLQKVPPESPIADVQKFHRAGLLFLRGSYEDASELYGDLTGEIPQPPFGWGEETEFAVFLSPATAPRLPAFRAAAMNNRAVTLLQKAENRGDFPSDETIFLLEEAVRLSPDSPAIFYNLGRAYLNRHEWARAKEALEEALRGRPDDPLTLAFLSQACCGAGDADCAEQRARQALENHPDLAEAHLAMACYHLGRADPNLAGREIEQALRLAEEESKRRRAQEIALRSVPVPYPTWAAYQAAWAQRSLPLLTRSRLAQAKRYLVQFYREPPPDFGEYLWALVFGGESPLDLAWEEVDRAAEVLPAGYEALCLRGEIALAWGNMEEAADFFLEAQEKAPHDRESYLRLAEIYLRQWQSLQEAGRSDEASLLLSRASGQYRRLVDEGIDPVQGYLGLGEVAQRSGLDEEALLEYRWAVDLDPNCAEAYLRMGLVERELGWETEALDHFTLAAGRAGRNEVLLAAEVERGSILLERYLGGDPPLRSREWLNEARAAFGRAVELPEKGFRYDTSGVAVRPAISFGADYDLRALCGLGRVAYEEGNYVEAERYFLKAWERNRDFFEALYGLGRVYLAQKEKVEKALEYLQRAVERSPRSIAANYYLGMAYSAQLQENRARRTFEKVVRLCQEEEITRADDQKACQEVERRTYGFP